MIGPKPAKDGKHGLSSIADATHFPYLRAHYQAVTRASRGAEVRESFDLLARYRLEEDDEGKQTRQWWVAMRKHHEALDDDRILIHQQVGGDPESIESWYWNGRFPDEEARPWPFDAWRYLGSAALVVFDAVLPLYGQVIVEDEGGEIEPPLPRELARLTVRLKKPPGNLSHMDPFRFSIQYDRERKYDVHIDEYVNTDLIRSISSDGWTLVSTWSKPKPTALSKLASAWIPSQRTYRDYKLGLTTMLTTRSFDTGAFPDHWLWPRNLGKGSW
jgi:hypothetical protein